MWPNRHVFYHGLENIRSKPDAATPKMMNSVVRPAPSAKYGKKNSLFGAGGRSTTAGSGVIRTSPCSFNRLRRPITDIGEDAEILTTPCCGVTSPAISFKKNDAWP